MKKVLATILALVMALGVTTMAWADDTLEQKVYAAKANGAITLDAGNFTIPSGVATGSTVPTGLTISGAGAGKTVINVSGITPGESSGTYFFDGGKSVTFKDLTIDFGSASDYDGFIRAGDMTFENVTIKGMGSHWGTGTVTFTNCDFEYPDQYNKWTYNLWTYTGKVFNFEGCTFNTKLGGGNEQNPGHGKFVNVYSQGSTKEKVTLTLNECTFVTTEVEGNTVVPDKPILKIGNGNAWDITVTKANTTAAKAAVDEKTGSNLYGSGSNEGINANNGVKVEVDNVTTWNDGEKQADVPTPTPDPTPEQPPRYYYNSTTTTTDTKADDTKGSPKTFDAGVGIYAVTAVLSVTGMAWAAKKRGN